ncbi:MAG: M48 family metalloprotease [Xanthomonadaceae bacterium]|jgi:Zn-dependent protease with chaperone function|nr:M48 family metalloprotease [Xanthomonadaceae bacterium]
MTATKSYRALIQRLEIQAQRSPARYRFKLLLLALAGYAVIGLALLLSFGTLAAMLLYQIIARPETSPFVAIPVILLLMSGGAVVHAIWFRFEMPDGHLLQPEEAPDLWREVDRLRQKTQAPPLHGILITADFNAAAIYVPDGLWFKPHRHYLMLGLPLLQLLDHRQLAAVIAHEFGHFGTEDGRFASWIYRLRLSWYRLLDGLNRQGSVMGWLFILFYRWYAPYFDAYSLVFARSNEYEADRVAAQITDAPTLAAALIRIKLATDCLDHGFLLELSSSAKQQLHPPAQLYRNLIDSLRTSEAAQARMLPILLRSVPAPAIPIPPWHNGWPPSASRRIPSIPIGIRPVRSFQMHYASGSNAVSTGNGANGSNRDGGKIIVKHKSSSAAWRNWMRNRYATTSRSWNTLA